MESAVHKLTLVVLVNSLLLAACGSGVGPAFPDGPPADIDSSGLVFDAPPGSIDSGGPVFYDANTTPPIDSSPQACLLQSSYANLTIGTSGTPFVGAGNRNTAGNYSVGVYTQAVAGEAIAIFIVENAGIFAGGFTTGTSTDTTTCGACLQLYGGYTMPDLSDATQVYRATSSAANITTFTNLPAAAGRTSRIEGVFSTVSLQGFDVATQQALPNCMSTVTNVSFVWDITWAQ